MSQALLPLSFPEPGLRPDVQEIADRRAKLRALLEGDLDFHGVSEGLPLHRIHPFPAKFPPALPRLFIEHLTQPGEPVLDPMMGSGTTLLEAARLGRFPLGADIDPLALRLVQAKWVYPHPESFHEAAVRTLALARQITPETLAALWEDMDAPTQAFIEYWFLPQTQQELLALRWAIDQESDPVLRLWLWLAFSGIIVAKGGTVALARDLSHTRPHRVKKQPKSALVAFRERVKRLQRLLAALPPASATAWGLWEGDAQHLPLAANRVALIITSPPYASNAIDYMRAHKFTLVWWGYSVRRLGALRREYIGGEALQGVPLEPLPEPAQKAVQKIAEVDLRKSKVLHRYFSEMRRVLAEMARVLHPGGVAVLVVGDSTMRGLSTQTPQALAAIGEQVGLDWVGTGVRHLDRDRRMMPARKGRKDSPIEQRMHEEYVLGFLKPEGASDE